MGVLPPDFSRAIRYPNTNNIFINNTLFSIYSNILRRQIDPLMNLSITSTFAPLDDTNRFTPFESSFQRSYACEVRRLKTPVTAIISVVVAAYALIRGGYMLFISLAAWYEKRGEHTGLTRFYP